jgi:hypothetical protein
VISTYGVYPNLGGFHLCKISCLCGDVVVVVVALFNKEHTVLVRFFLLNLHAACPSCLLQALRVGHIFTHWGWTYSYFVYVDTYVSSSNENDP